MLILSLTREPAIIFSNYHEVRPNENKFIIEMKYRIDEIQNYQMNKTQPYYLLVKMYTVIVRTFINFT